MNRNLVIAILLSATLAPGLYAQARSYRSGADQVREVHGTIPVVRPVRLRINTRLASVHIQGQSPAGANPPQLSYTIVLRTHAGAGALAYLQSWPITVQRSGAIVYIQTGTPDAQSVEPAQLTVELRVPAQVSEIVADTEVGDLYADQLATPLVLAAQAGNIHVGSNAGSVLAFSRGGDVIVGQAQAVRANATGAIRVNRADGPVYLTTSGGEVAVRRAAAALTIVSNGGGIDIGDADGPVAAFSEGGNISLGNAQAWARLQTVGGNIVVNSARQLEVSTRSGDIRLERLLAGVEAQTGSGRVDAVFAPGAKLSNSEIVSRQGRIAVTLPSSVGAQVWAQIRDPQGVQITGDYPQLSGDSARAVLNGGGAQLRLLTNMSEITVHKPQEHL
ncbi:MAG TPA: hypothetical protein VN709_11345 [Terriglobales bacterium]|nr:hypothetical protein [Terriglobales bacterium]